MMNIRPVFWTQSRLMRAVGALLLVFTGLGTRGQQALPNGCVQAWQKQLTAYQQQCSDVGLVEVTKEPQHVVGPGLSEGADVAFSKIQRILDKSVQNGILSKDLTLFLSEVTTVGKEWIEREGYALGYFLGYSQGVLRAGDQLQWAGVNFVDNDFEKRMNPPRALTCTKLPDYFAQADRNCTVIEKNGDSSVIVISRYLKPASDEMISERFGCWWRLVFIKERPDCGSLSQEQKNQVFQEDIRALGEHQQEKPEAKK